MEEPTSSKRTNLKSVVSLIIFLVCGSLQHSRKSLSIIQLVAAQEQSAVLDYMLQQTSSRNGSPNELLEQTSSSTSRSLLSSEKPEAIATADNTVEVKVPPQSPDESFSACLMLKDNNHRLAEWVAYHYYALPLRTLVVYVDPYSRVHPRDILQKWERVINITYWDQVTDINLNKGHFKGNFTEQQRKIKRQEAFFASCGWHLRAQNRTWAMWIDVDEYLLFDHDKLPAQVPLVNKPGFVSTLLKQAERNNGTSIPSQPLLKNQTCVVVPRIMLSGYESNKEEVTPGVPDYLHPFRFNTLRFRHYSEAKGSNGKSLLRVDLWNAPPKRPRTFKVHRVVNECPKSPRLGDHPLRINHYLGSWETYSFVADPRYKNNQTIARQRWEKFSAMHPKRGGHDDWIRSWIANFAAWQGPEATKYLLADIGPAFNSSTALFKGQPYTLEE